jgi:hypothetical protein
MHSNGVLRWIVCIVLCVVGSGGFAFALDVDRGELESTAQEAVEFQNYEGPQQEIESAETIRGIGNQLGATSLQPEAESAYFDRYRVVHAVDPDVDEGFDADIFFILPNAEVDHIDNVRRIVAGYLTSAYGYAPEDAGVLAEFVTIYNAVHRNELGYFENRYKQVVLSYLEESAVGISTLYSDWPGNTQMVIPLSETAAPGMIGALDTMQLTDTAVIDQLRMREDMGIAERKAMVELMERVIDERREALEEEREAIAQEREAVEEEQEQVEEDLDEVREAQEQADEEEPSAEEQEELDEEEARLEEEQEELAQREQELEEREEEAAAEEEQIDEMTEEVREQREEIAEDQREQMGEEQPEEPAEEEAEEETAARQAVEPVPFLRIRETGGERFRQYVSVNPRSGEIARRSPVDRITSTQVATVQGDFLAVARRDGRASLVLIDNESLELLRSGTERVFPQSVVEPAQAGERIYAVVDDDGQWYLGKFNGGLGLMERSSVTVDPHTSIRVVADRVLAQRSDGTIVALSVSDMSTAGE